MGCCLSTKNPETNSPKPISPSSTNTRAPPVSHPEEETVVKEVLSETPISRIQESELLKHSSPRAKLQQNEIVLEEPKKVVATEELNEEVSEICSTLSESCVSTATTATVEMNNLGDDDNEVTQIRKRRVAKDRLVNRPQKVQSRRSENSPGRVRSGPVRDGRGQGNNGVRRGSVMGGERRSRSPVTRVDGAGSRAGLSRCPSGRRTGKSPGRFGPTECGEKNSRVENGDAPSRFGQAGLGQRNSRVERVDPKLENRVERVDTREEDPETRLNPANDESLENPHVSLECFIFL